MFVRKNKNRSGSYSIQIIEKRGRKNHLVKTLGSGQTEEEIAQLVHQAELEITRLKAQPSLFVNRTTAQIRGLLSQVSNSDILLIGPEQVLGKIYSQMGYGSIDSFRSGQEYFRHLVIGRLLYPSSKLKTVDYLYRYQQIKISVDSLYKYMDKLEGKLKKQIEQTTYQHTKKILKGKLGVIFYDMTTLYFETDREDEWRQRGFSKDGKHHHPQIKLGIVVASQGYPLGYDIFEGSKFEGHTLIPVLEQIQEKFSISSPVVIADAGLLSNKNIIELEKAGYQYILGGKIKNESTKIKDKVLKKKIDVDRPILLRKGKQKIIISYSPKRAAKDKHNRKRGLERLEKKLQNGKLTKTHINNRGYNKYLQMDGTIAISIDYEKFKNDAKWDGLKSYVTNTTLSRKKVIEAYRNLWHIEKAFRISKFDLKLRPIYHRVKKRIEAHICICFVAYAVYKELERILKKQKVSFSAARAIELSKTMYAIRIVMPDTLVIEQVNLVMTEQQQILVDAIKLSKIT